MKKGLTELVFILDKSGSMASMTDDTIGGFNSMIEKQKKQEGECIVSLVLFDSCSQVVFDRVPLQDVPLLTEAEYVAGGCTALTDAIGGAIHHISNVHKYGREDDVPEKTMFIVTTDGMENASTDYSADKVRAMVSEKQEKEEWEFLFLAANIDAVQTASNYGIRKERSVRFHNDHDGIATNYSVISETVTSFRVSKVNDCWSESIRKDYETRKAKKEGR